MEFNVLMFGVWIALIARAWVRRYKVPPTRKEVAERSAALAKEDWTRTVELDEEDWQLLRQVEIDAMQRHARERARGLRA